MCDKVFYYEDENGQISFPFGVGRSTLAPERELKFLQFSPDAPLPENFPITLFDLLKKSNNDNTQ